LSRHQSILEEDGKDGLIMAETALTTTVAGVRPSVRVIRDTIGISRERMARLLDVSTKTIERAEAQCTWPTSRTATERLAKLSQIVDLGLQVYTPKGFQSFMRDPMPVWEGRTALQMIEAGDINSVYGEIVSDYEGGAF
jgi:DNA-binding XRE family transcriptional regulator